MEELLDSLKKAGVVSADALGFESGETAKQALASAIKATGMSEGFEADSVDVAARTFDAVKLCSTGDAFATAKDATGGNGQLVLNETYGTEGKTGLSIADAAKAFEGFANTPLDKMVANSIDLNVNISTQSSLAEAFFKTVYIEPGQQGISFKTTMEYAYVPYTYDSIKGKVDFKKIPVMDLVTKDNTLLNGEGTTIYPVYRAESKDFFLDDSAVKENINYRGEDVVTAPLLLGKTLNVKELAQTANMITKAPFTQSDELSSQAEIENIYVKDKNDAIVKLPVKGLAGTMAVYTAEGDVNHDLTWAFNANLKIDDQTKDVSGSALSTGLPAGSTVTVEFTVQGSGHTATANVVIGQLSKRVVSAVDSNGEALTLTAEQEAYLDSLAATAFDANWAITNVSLLSKGTFITKETTNVLAGVFIGSPISSEASVLRNIGSVDGTGIRELASKVQIALENKAIRTLTNFFNELSVSMANGNELRFRGIGRDIAKPTVKSNNINIAAVLNSMTDSGKKEDIKSRIKDLLEDMIVTMAIESGYESNVDTVFGAGRVINVIVGAHTRLLPYLPNDFYIGERFNVQITTKSHELLTDSIYVSFGGVDKINTDNKTMDKFRFGNRILAPSLVGDVNGNFDGRPIKFNTVLPVSGHHVNIPVLGKITVTGIPTALETKI